MSDKHFLARWSRLKAAAATGHEVPTSSAVPSQPAPARLKPGAGTQAPGPNNPAPLPPIESLTPESDFTPFLREGVEDAIKRRALKTLFQDPRFNVMDGLDVYIDDYSKPDPLPEGWLEKLNQVARLGEYREPDPDAATHDPQPETPEARAESDIPPEVPEEGSTEPSEPQKPV